MDTSTSLRWSGVFFYLATLTVVYGQDATTSPASQPASTSPAAQTTAQISPTVQAYQQEQQALAQQYQALVAQGATQDQLAAWQQQNATRFAAQQQRAQAMASPLQTLPVNAQTNIPPNASQTLRDFLTTRAALANARAQLHNQLVQGLSSTASTDQISQMQAQEAEMFEQQHASDLQVQAQRAQTLVKEGTPTSLAVPPPLQIPANATSQMAAFLTQRDRLVRARIQLWNQYATADPSVRDAAVQQWEQQNATSLQQLQQLAQALAQTTPTTE